MLFGIARVGKLYVMDHPGRTCVFTHPVDLHGEPGLRVEVVACDGADAKIKCGAGVLEGGIVGAFTEGGDGRELCMDMCGYITLGMSAQLHEMLVMVVVVVVLKKADID